MNKLEEIYTGFSNLLLGKERELAEERSKVCIECPIFKDNFCSKELGGCGCYIPSKASSPNSKCPKDKWIK
jgi:hypothetical protein